MFILQGQPWGDIVIDHYHWLFTSSLNLSGHVSSIWFMAIESAQIWITLAHFYVRRVISATRLIIFNKRTFEFLELMHVSQYLMKRTMCLTLIFFYFWYLPFPHYRHISLSPYSSMYRIQYFEHVWHDMY